MPALAPPTSAPVASRQPWIRSASFDGLYVLAPPFLALLGVLLLPDTYRTTSRMPLVAWVGLVVLIDVAHVYSTLFRTYLDPVRRRQHRTLLWVAPLACYAVGIALYAASGLWFWRVLAYLAVFHFIRQQYGFLRLYSRREPAAGAGRQLDTVLIYYATIYPLLYWHLSAPRNFNWFVDGDFVQYNWPVGRLAATIVYVALLVAYAYKEVRQWQQTRQFNWPRNLLVAGTLVSWYCGIVLFNGDLAFTLLNVVAHGIPYLALVWAASHPDAPKQANSLPHRRAAAPWWTGRYGIIGFLAVLMGLAFLEEGVWDGLVWREHAPVFGWFHSLPAVTDSVGLMLLVPLLALPQATHYVLDGFIWRRGQ